MFSKIKCNTVQDDLLAGSLFWRMAIYSTFRQY